jgi:hypothetical protein
MSFSAEQRPFMLRWFLPAVLVLAGIGLGTLAVRWLSDPANVSLQDFVEYWAAGRANARGDNPYEAAVLFGYEKQVSPDLTDAIMMWNPPWTLTVAIPFGVLPARVSHLPWLLLNLAILLGCADWLWRYYGGPARDRWLACVVALGFVPTFFVLRMGQISPLILLGVVGFLYFEQRGRWGWAGAVVALAAVKPHLVYLFAVALGLWALERRRWWIFLGGGLTLLGLMILPLACNPQVLQQYRHAMTHQPPQMLSPTLGALLRLAFGLHHLWLQLVPQFFGLAWLGIYWLRHRKDWVWAEQTPVLLLASFLTTSYGAWPFDHVVVLVAVIQAAVWVFQGRQQGMAGFALITLVGFDVLALLLMNIRWSDQYWYVWMTPMLLFSYLALRKQTFVLGRETVRPRCA